MEKFLVQEVEDRKGLDNLYSTSALTIEGLCGDRDNLTAWFDWLDKSDAIGKDTVVFNIIKGELMNKTYELTGDNAYPDDLTIVSVTGINQVRVAISSRRLGARWFDDIVDNNLRREEKKNKFY